MVRKFDEWLSSFRTSISDYKYYVNFDKVYQNIDEMKVELNILNSLIGSKDFDDDFRSICRKYPNILKCIPLLIAVRQYEIEVQDTKGKIVFDFSKYKKEFSEENYLKIEGLIRKYISYL